ncbi:glycine cleavage system protein H [[Clostridium] sordellii]|uniref:glycine cleavage system protein GcvH n=1 Tax=Paraclostridium sordellii TaxID=1505 RepID=UPI0005E7A5CA|nr:glycine cleavage system protein GcvH [Paeniclostridium sordellii]CEN90472.1 glycine cleavage system protein H [[Clostridium] sordellii] [Paeniclostridium sordellii]CEN92004.1 glycine cleavage system protein H [[Clostridium] sordellii] [Paeniclostridium sordellii]CEQ13665.1 glycine cleavage system protein H [[Clostridium] sordellii] [Paeniclostridium sordellii]
MKVIPSLKYCREHTWVKIEGEYAYIGITDYAQDQLGEILFVEMPEVEDEITKGEDFGVVESSKVASDLIAPISGEVVEINEMLEDEPEAINEDAYDAWIIKVKISDEEELNSLLNSNGYESSIE